MRNRGLCMAGSVQVNTAKFSLFLGAGDSLMFVDSVLGVSLMESKRVRR